MRSPHSSYLHPRAISRAKAVVVAIESVAVADAGIEVIDLAARVKPVAIVEQVLPAVLRPLPCMYLGKVVKHAGSCCPRKNTHICNAGIGEVQPVAACEKCGRYKVSEDAVADAEEGAA